MNEFAFHGEYLRKDGLGDLEAFSTTKRESVVVNGED
jgi:hypothetical protein